MTPNTVGTRTLDLSNVELALRFINGVMFEYYVGATFANSYGFVVRANHIASPDDFRVTYQTTDFDDLYGDAHQIDAYIQSLYPLEKINGFIADGARPVAARSR